MLSGAFRASFAVERPDQRTDQPIKTIKGGEMGVVFKFLHRHTAVSKGKAKTIIQKIHINTGNQQNMLKRLYFNMFKCKNTFPNSQNDVLINSNE